MFVWRDFGNGIYAFDSGHVCAVLAAIHTIVKDGRVADMTDRALVQRGAGRDRHIGLKEAQTGFLLAEPCQLGCTLVKDLVRGFWDTDLELDVQGLEVRMEGLPCRGG